MFTAASLIIAKNWEKPKCPSQGAWVNKVWVLQQWNTAQQ